MALEIQQSSTFLSLPSEIRLEIYRLLLSPKDAGLTIRSLFIRKLYDSIFMTQQEKGFCTAVLRVCRQVTSEALSILYAGPVWRCGCRMDKLARQVGASNFARIKHMTIDADDLPDIVRQLYPMSSEQSTPASPFLSFDRVETLEVDGYHSAALNNWGSYKTRVEALRLCRLAKRLLELHPRLSYLLQRSASGNGGADARDLGLARVRWKFVRDREQASGEDHFVDLVEIQSMLQAILDIDQISSRSSVPTWDRTGVFRQYPYLPTMAVTQI